MRVALLICDTPAAPIEAEFGDYYAMFSSLLKHDQIQFDRFDVTTQTYPKNFDEYEAVLMTGSNLPWIKKLIETIQYLDKTEIKIIGVCFGHQIVAQALGGKGNQVILSEVEKNPKGWEVGWESITLTSEGSKYLKLGSKANIAIQEMHQDHVSVIPTGFTAIASTEHSPVQMMIKSGRYWCVQGHPEYSAKFVQALIDLRLKSNIFSAAFIATLKNLNQPLDSTRVLTSPLRARHAPIERNKINHGLVDSGSSSMTLPFDSNKLSHINHIMKDVEQQDGPIEDINDYEQEQQEEQPYGQSVPSYENKTGDGFYEGPNSPPPPPPVNQYLQPQSYYQPPTDGSAYQSYEFVQEPSHSSQYSAPEGHQAENGYGDETHGNTSYNIALDTLKSPQAPRKHTRKVSFTADMAPHIVKRESIKEFSYVLNELPNDKSQNEFGEPYLPGGQVTVIPLETVVQATYTWEIPTALLFENEKFVSLPFGPKDWSWQMMYTGVYPNGVGDTAGQYFSVFLRTVKNDNELADSSWTRPISYFGIKLKQETTSNPTVDSAPDYIEQISDSEFKSFTEERQGWGFNEFCPLPFPFDQVVFPDSTIHLTAVISGSMFLKTSTIQYEESIPVTNILNQQMLITSPFGPDDCSWNVEFAPFTDPQGNMTHFSGHLKPIKSQFEESLGPSWERAISALSLQLVDPVSNVILSSKCLTGAFIYSDTNFSAGWDDFLLLDQYSLPDPALVKVKVTWDPELLRDYTFLGKTRTALAKTSSCYLASESELEQSRLDLSLAETKLARQEYGLQELAAVRERLKLITAELTESRNTENEYSMSQIRVSTVKERLALLRNSLDADFSNNVHDANDGDLNVQLQISKSEYACLFLEKAQIELKLSQALSELQFVNRSSRDNLLLAPIPSYEENAYFALEPLELIQHALETGRNEILVGKASLEEVHSKLYERNLSEISGMDRAGFIADISMVQCGLDVANAKLHEAAIHLHMMHDQVDFMNVQNELHDLRLQFSDKKSKLEGFQVLSPTILQPPPILANFPMKAKSKRSSSAQFNELEQQTEIKAVNTRIDSLADLVKLKINVPSKSTKSFRVDDLEPWTPIESYGLGVDGRKLQMLLLELERKQKSIGWFAYFILCLSACFISYSTVFVICDPMIPSPYFNSFQPICETVVLPITSKTHQALHQASERVVLEFLPSYLGRVYSGISRLKNMTSETIIKTMNRAVQQGSSTAGPNPESLFTEAIHPIDHDSPKTVSNSNAQPTPDSSTVPISRYAEEGKFDQEPSDSSLSNSFTPSYSKIKTLAESSSVWTNPSQTTRPIASSILSSDSASTTPDIGDAEAILEETEIIVPIISISTGVKSNSKNVPQVLDKIVDVVEDLPFHLESSFSIGTFSTSIKTKETLLKTVEAKEAMKTVKKVKSTEIVGTTKTLPASSKSTAKETVKVAEILDSEIDILEEEGMTESPVEAEIFKATQTIIAAEVSKATEILKSSASFDTIELFKAASIAKVIETPKVKLSAKAKETIMPVKTVDANENIILLETPESSSSIENVHILKTSETPKAKRNLKTKKFLDFTRASRTLKATETLQSTEIPENTEAPEALEAKGFLSDIVEIAESLEAEEASEAASKIVQTVKSPKVLKATAIVPKIVQESPEMSKATTVDPKIVQIAESQETTESKMIPETLESTDILQHLLSTDIPEPSEDTNILQASVLDDTEIQDAPVAIGSLEHSEMTEAEMLEPSEMPEAETLEPSLTSEVEMSVVKTPVVKTPVVEVLEPSVLSEAETLESSVMLDTEIPKAEILEGDFLEREILDDPEILEASEIFQTLAVENYTTTDVISTINAIPTQPLSTLPIPLVYESPVNSPTTVFKAVPTAPISSVEIVSSLPVTPTSVSQAMPLASPTPTLLNATPKVGIAFGPARISSLASPTSLQSSTTLTPLYMTPTQSAKPADYLSSFSFKALKESYLKRLKEESGEEEDDSVPSVTDSSPSPESDHVSPLYINGEEL